MKASYNYKQIGNTCINKQRRHVELGNETKKKKPSRRKRKTYSNSRRQVSDETVTNLLFRHKDSVVE